MALDPELARAVYEPLAKQLGFTIERTAQGVLGIVVANMVRTIRTISVERGHDPRNFVLMPFGGAGPLHARDVALSLGIRELLIPAAPGIVCAQGLVVSDQKEDFVTSQRFGLDEAGMEKLTTLLGELLARADQWFAHEQAQHIERELEFSVDARYIGQNFELAVPIAGARLWRRVMYRVSRSCTVLSALRTKPLMVTPALMIRLKSSTYAYQRAPVCTSLLRPHCPPKRWALKHNYVSGVRFTFRRHKRSIPVFMPALI